MIEGSYEGGCAAAARQFNTTAKTAKWVERFRAEGVDGWRGNLDERNDSVASTRRRSPQNGPSIRAERRRWFAGLSMAPHQTDRQRPDNSYSHLTRLECRRCSRGSPQCSISVNECTGNASQKLGRSPRGREFNGRSRCPGGGKTQQPTSRRCHSRTSDDLQRPRATRHANSGAQVQAELLSYE